MLFIRNTNGEPVLNKCFAVAQYLSARRLPIMRMEWVIAAVFLATMFIAGGEVLAADFHVSATSDGKGDGSAERPWDLTTALASPAAVKPGDTIWLHEGIYRGGFVARLKGDAGKPITVRSKRGRPVIIDTLPRDERDNGLLLLGGADTVYRDFEVTCSHPKRETAIAGSWPADIRRGSIDIRGDRISAINLVVHDQAGGFGFWAEGEGGEIYGCVIYNNGWQGPDRAHGHGIYVQNARGTKRIANNVVFHQFAYGIHAYGSEKASLKGLLIEGNIGFENGAASKSGERSAGIMVGGGCPAERITVRDNVVVGGNIRLGYTWGAKNVDASVTGNYCDGGLVLRDFHQAVVSKNTLVASSKVVQLEAAERLLISGLTWDDNDCFVIDGRWGECAVVEGGKARSLSFHQWRSETGADAKSRFTKGKPHKLQVHVFPNEHEAGHAHVAVLNPGGLPEVDVDLSSVLNLGQRFRIHSVKGLGGEPVAATTFDGKLVRLPIRPIKAPLPIGLADAKLPETEPEFAVFLVRSDP